MVRFIGERPLFRRLPAVLLAVILIGLPVIPDTGAKDAHPKMRAAPFSSWSNDSLIVPWHDPAIQPSIAACPDGSLFVVWIDGWWETPRLFFKKLDPTGATLIPMTQVSDDWIDIDNSTPTALAGTDGSLHVIWSGGSPATRHVSICHRAFNSTGAATSATVKNWFNTTVDSPLAWLYHNLSASILPDGNLSVGFEVSWSNMLNGGPPPEKYPTIGWMRLAPNGTKLAEAGLNMISRDNATGGKQRNPALATGADGRTHAFWLDLTEPISSLLRWSIVNGTGNGTQGFMLLCGEPGPCLSAVTGPGDDISVVFIDRDQSSVKMVSYPVSDTPINSTSRTVYATDFNASGEMEPRWCVRAVRDGMGDVVVGCEGLPVGDFGPNIDPYYMGLFAVAPGGSIIFSEPCFIGEYFNVSTPPTAMPPHLLPALAASPKNEVFLCWQLRYKTIPERPLGLHLVHTVFGDVGLTNLTFHFNGTEPLVNDRINVTAELFNIADNAAGAITVLLSIDGKILDVGDFVVGAKERRTVAFGWTAVGGNHTLGLRLDPGVNQNDDPSNDMVEGWLNVSLPPDLFITPENIAFSDEEPFAGADICITASIGNAGNIPGEGDIVLSLDGVRLAGAQKLIAPSDHRFIFAVWTAVAGNHTVKVDITNCSPPDGNLSNNAASKRLTVREEPPDIPPSISILYPATGAPLSGIVEIRGTASARQHADELIVELRFDNLTWMPATGAANWTFRWNTSAVPDGLHTIEARAVLRNLSSMASIPVEVRNAIGPAIWFEKTSPPENFTMHEDQTVWFTAEVGARPAPGGIEYHWYVDGVISTSGEDMRQFEFSANFSSAGKHIVSVMALVNFTPEPLRAYNSWNFTVINVDRPPMITSAIPVESPVVFRKDEPPNFFVLAKDPDGDALTYSWKLDGVPIPGTNKLFFEARSLQPGTHNLSVTVSAGGLNATVWWEVRVQDSSVTVSRGIPFMAAMLAVVIAMVVVIMILAPVLRRRRR
jgi:hypothetical protein